MPTWMQVYVVKVISANHGAGVSYIGELLYNDETKVSNVTLQKKKNQP